MYIMYYFAYGSNINAEHFKRFCPNAVITQQHAILPNYNIELHTIPSAPEWKAFATIVPSESHHVHGILYKIECPKELKSLNRKEGVHLKWYKEKNVTVILNDTHEIKDCSTYVMVYGISVSNIPSRRYINIFKRDYDTLVQNCSLITCENPPPLSRNTKCSVLSF